MRTMPEEDEVFYCWHRRDRNPAPVNAPTAYGAALRYAQSNNLRNGSNIKVLPARYMQTFIAHIGIVVTEKEDA